MLLLPTEENTNAGGGGRLQPVDPAGAGTYLPMKFWLCNIVCPYRKVNQQWGYERWVWETQAKNLFFRKVFWPTGMCHFQQGCFRSTQVVRRQESTLVCPSTSWQEPAALPTLPQVLPQLWLWPQGTALCFPFEYRTAWGQSCSCTELHTGMGGTQRCCGCNSLTVN